MYRKDFHHLSPGDKGAGWSVKVQDQRYIKAKKEGEKNKGFTNVTISLQIWFE